MMFYEFMEKMDDMKDEAVVSYFHKILDEMKAHITEPDDIRFILEYMEGTLTELESMDCFGTEGMRL